MKSPNSKPAGSLPTTWELRTYDVWGNARYGYEVNDVYSAGEVELRIPQTRHNIGVAWHVCRNPTCPENNPCGHTPRHPEGHHRESHSVLPIEIQPEGFQHTISTCPDCGSEVALESQEFISASPSDRQIKLAFGVSCRISTDGTGLHITVVRERDGYPIGEMYCTSHESLIPVRKGGK